MSLSLNQFVEQVVGMNDEEISEQFLDLIENILIKKGDLNLAGPSKPSDIPLCNELHEIVELITTRDDPSHRQSH